MQLHVVGYSENINLLSYADLSGVYTFSFYNIHLLTSPSTSSNTSLNSEKLFAHGGKCSFTKTKSFTCELKSYFGNKYVQLFSLKCHALLFIFEKKWIKYPRQASQLFFQVKLVILLQLKQWWSAFLQGFHCTSVHDSVSCVVPILPHSIL